jgi:hypothetical protein
MKATATLWAFRDAKAHVRPHLLRRGKKASSLAIFSFMPGNGELRELPKPGVLMWRTSGRCLYMAHHCCEHQCGECVVLPVESVPAQVAAGPPFDEQALPDEHISLLHRYPNSLAHRGACCLLASADVFSLFAPSVGPGHETSSSNAFVLTPRL